MLVRKTKSKEMGMYILTKIITGYWYSVSIKSKTITRSPVYGGIREVCLN